MLKTFEILLFLRKIMVVSLLGNMSNSLVEISRLQRQSARSLNQDQAVGNRFLLEKFIN